MAEQSAGCCSNSHSEKTEICFWVGKEGVFKLCSGYNCVNVNESEALHS